jgi:hypothetical protein
MIAWGHPSAIVGEQLGLGIIERVAAHNPAVAFNV